MLGLKEDFQKLDKVLKEFSFLNLFVLMLLMGTQNILPISLNL